MAGQKRNECLCTFRNWTINEYGDHEFQWRSLADPFAHLRWIISGDETCWLVDRRAVLPGDEVLTGGGGARKQQLLVVSAIDD